MLPILGRAYATYVDVTSLTGVQSETVSILGITQKSAWFMLQRVLETLAAMAAAAVEGPVEGGETNVGAKEPNIHEHMKPYAERSKRLLWLD